MASTTLRAWSIIQYVSGVASNILRAQKYSRSVWFFEADFWGWVWAGLAHVKITGYQAVLLLLRSLLVVK
jgi:hypothetical protein